jgi:AGZA family xanthine/uracil permease-like MFS transporter
MLYRVRGSLLIGIVIVAITSWPRNSAVTYFPHTPAGDDLFDFFKQVVTFRPLERIGGAIAVSTLLRRPKLSLSDLC